MSIIMAQLHTYLCMLAFVYLSVAHHPKDDPFLYGTFPRDFFWGTATSAYQIEGAWNVDGKGESIWDNFTHSSGNIFNNEDGDEACKSYYKFKEDIALLRDMGVTHYRFSLSWSRIFPNGKKDSYNPLGMQYYKNLTSELKAAGIRPMATLYHWDLPQALQDEGGLLSPDFEDWFNDYADKCFAELGSDVKIWVTINEPWVSCFLGYGIGIHAPGFRESPGTQPYICGHNMIKAHAKAWHTYNDKYRSTQYGKVSISLDAEWKEPKTNSSEDIEAAERALAFRTGWFAEPIFGNGDYPQAMKDIIARKSAAQGFTSSRLPTFTAAEKAYVRGSYDYFGLNHYTSHFVANSPAPDTNSPDYNGDQDISLSTDPAWPTSGSSWLRAVPWGLRKLLGWIKDEFGNPPVYITENGVSDNNGTLRDQHRIDFYSSYINNVLKAIRKDGCNVKGYTAWSLMDNFEWQQGYSEKFGIHYVDFNDPERPRVAKDSANWFRQLICNNGFINPSRSRYSNRYRNMYRYRYRYNRRRVCSGYY